ncbi:SAM-dependent methyltransferase [Actinocrispum wychmicini]|uniref:S-adenosyl methyltransferase n=1 Tax=Actinocrispum wychmicini TaxID=1213861 RepID=A0A4R2IPJ1_9PSEU|nr:SAM-dependent methyltransferase [Actinocrispum wychmicini]TCO46532.1 S-adenosyl methyltransferase [Actinocrispum wychmicini]
MSGQVSWIPTDIDLKRASPARVYDYLLGGSWNFDVDRMMAQQAINAMPWVRDLARYNRQFLGRAVRFCASDGVRQFLDLGSGMPTAKSVHEMAGEIAPDSHVVYVEQEPVAIAHSELILAPVEGADIVAADMCDVLGVLADPTTGSLIDLTEPVGVIMASSLHYVLDAAQASATVAAYMDAVAPGSYLVLSHIADNQGDGSEEVQGLVELSKTTSAAGVARSREWIAGLFDGLDMVEPGLVYTSQWRPDDGLRLVRDLPAHASLLAAVACKP